MSLDKRLELEQRAPRRRTHELEFDVDAFEVSHAGASHDKPFPLSAATAPQQELVPLDMDSRTDFARRAISLARSRACARR